ncbi:hypothetical protein; putative membrane protein [Pseudomonas entomophila L48]|uniref:Glycosyltransferase RgtA/B/C/D-like domain-containing protein n=2 Tax=Pseudomonas entomophila TaxID=312306 RepID=Q1I2Z6_PSEE4|nr:hypothetical protein; putative membrane protein [Pseudomonas entomophila L48]
MVSFFPQCTSTVGHGVAWVFYPAALLISSVYAHLGPLGIRLSGIVLTLAWFVLLAYWCRRQAAEGGIGRFSFLAAFAALGVMPYLWVFSRPEQFMLLPLLIMCMVALLTPVQNSRKRQLAVTVGLVVVLSVFFYAHPKSVFFAPFALVATWFATRGSSLLIRTGLVLYILVLSGQVLHDASLLGGCQDAPAVQALLATNSLLPGMLLEDPVAFLVAAWQNVSLFPGRMLAHLTFNPTFQSGWLASLTEQPVWLRWLNPLIACALLVLVVGSHLLALLLAAIALIRRRLPAALLLAALLAAADLINAALYNLQNFYAGIQYIPLSLMIVTLLFHCVPTVPQWPGVRATGYLAVTLMSGLSLASLFALFSLVTPTLLRNAGYANASLPGQSLSIPLLNTQAHLDSILKLGDTCHIPRAGAEHVVLDHMTYFAYLQDSKPVHVLYVSELGYGADLLNGKLLPFLKARNSPGLITRCEWVPNELRDGQQRNDQGYCCVDFGNR